MSFKEPVIKIWDMDGKEKNVHTNVDANEHVASGHYTDKNPAAQDSLCVIAAKEKANSTKPVPVGIASPVADSNKKEAVEEPKAERKKNSKPRKA